MSNVVERMRRGERIGHDDPDYPQLWQEFEKTRALVAELNASHHTPDEQRSLLERIWGQDSDAEINVVWVYVSYLRKKLAALGADIQIKATRNAGYSLEEKA